MHTNVSPAVALVLVLFTLCTASSQQHSNPRAFLNLGDSGAGKSALTNLLVGATVSVESPTGNSTTKYPVAYPVVASGRGDTTFFPEGALIIDTPGFYDTDGLSLERIGMLVRGELFRHQLTSLTGVLLLVDGSAPRLSVARSLQQALTILGGPAALSHIVVVVTKASVPRPDGVTGESVLEHARESFARAGGLPERVTMVDLKSFDLVEESRGELATSGSAEAIVRYLSKVLQAGLPGGSNGEGFALSGMDELARKEEQYLTEELASEANWVTRTLQQPRVVSLTQTKTVMSNVAYNYDCNCQTVCRRRILGICTNKKTVCGTCVGTRQEPRQE